MSRGAACKESKLSPYADSRPTSPPAGEEPVTTPAPAPSRPHPLAPVLRPIAGALIALALVFPAAALSDALVPAVDARSCTGWQSTERPPNKIRVFRNEKGRVEVVDFRRYVEVVTASEWGSHLPMAAIEAGAVAVKQWAWSKTLVGRHRGSYVTRSGQCYDVTDGTRDQLYKPEKRQPTAKIKQAVANTWHLHVRKSGKFFQTGYRRGSPVACGRDADGWRLYARSVIKCANAGLSRQQIQFKYYGRDLTIHSTKGPTISAANARGTGDAQPADGEQSGQQQDGTRTQRRKASPSPTPSPESTRQSGDRQQRSTRRSASPRPTPGPNATAPKATPKPAASAKPRQRSRVANATPQPTPRAQATPQPLPPLDASLPSAEVLETLPYDDVALAVPGIAGLYSPWLAEWQKDWDEILDDYELAEELVDERSFEVARDVTLAAPEVASADELEIHPEPEVEALLMSRSGLEAALSPGYLLFR